MKRLEQKAVLAGLVALVLSACSSTGSDMSNQASASPPRADTAAGSGEGARDLGQDVNRSDSTAMSGQSSQGQTQSDTSGSSASTTGSGSSAGSGATSMGSTASGSGSMAGTSSGQYQSGASTSASTANTNSVVTLIETVPRESASVGTGSMAGAAVGGSTGSSSADRVYRVTLHMDDGSTRVVTQETAPVFRSGDRVRVENGMISQNR